MYIAPRFHTGFDIGSCSHYDIMTCNSLPDGIKKYVGLNSFKRIILRAYIVEKEAGICESPSKYLILVEPSYLLFIWLAMLFFNLLYVN